MLAGHVLAMFNNPVNAVPQAKSGTLRAIAATGSKRLSLMPDLPTVAESGYPGFETRTWYGLFGPAYDHARNPGTAEAVRRALWHEIEWFEQHLPVPAWRHFGQ